MVGESCRGQRSPLIISVALQLCIQCSRIIGSARLDIVMLTIMPCSIVSLLSSVSTQLRNLNIRRLFDLSLDVVTEGSTLYACPLGR